MTTQCRPETWLGIVLHITGIVTICLVAHDRHEIVMFYNQSSSCGFAQVIPGPDLVKMRL